MNLWIPVHDHRVFGQVRGRLVERGLGGLPLEVHSVLEPDARELLAVEVLDHRQDELDPLLIRGQALFFEVLLKLLHVLRADAKDVERFYEPDVLGPRDASDLAAPFKTPSQSPQTHPT